MAPRGAADIGAGICGLKSVAAAMADVEVLDDTIWETDGYGLIVSEALDGLPAALVPTSRPTSACEGAEGRAPAAARRPRVIARIDPQVGLLGRIAGDFSRIREPPGQAWSAYCRNGRISTAGSGQLALSRAGETVA